MLVLCLISQVEAPSLEYSRSGSVAQPFCVQIDLSGLNWV